MHSVFKLCEAWPTLLSIAQFSLGFILMTAKLVFTGISELSGWWFQPLWDDDIPNMMGKIIIQIFQTTNQ